MSNSPPSAAPLLRNPAQRGRDFPVASWGPAIIGFGAYHYTYATGHSGSICVAGFSPRKANLVVYISDFPGKERLLEKLGKHKGSLKQCLYINKLTDIDTAVLEKVLKGGIAETKKTWPVTAT
jgi:hypothetical protein